MQYKNKKLILILVLILVSLVFLKDVVSYFNSSVFETLPSTWVYTLRHTGVLYTYEPRFIDGFSIPYPPLYYCIWTGLSYLIGERLFTGELLTLVSSILVIVTLYFGCKYFIKDKLLALVCPILFLCSGYVAYWSVSPKSDMLGLLFSLIGILLVLRKKVYWSIPLFLLAFLTKQVFITAPIAVSLYLFFKRESRKTGIIFLLGYISSLLITLGVIQVWSHGHFLRHIFMFPIQSGGDTLINWNRLFWSFLVTVGNSPITILGSSVLVVLSFIKRKVGLLELWFSVSFVFMIWELGKKDSGTNYGLECVAIGSILVTMWLVSKFFKVNLNLGKEV